MRRDEQGTSLLEVLIALSLMGALCAAYFSLHWFSESVFRRQTLQAELQYSARHARQSIVEDVAQSESFSILDTRGGAEVLLGSEGNCLHLVLSDQMVDYYIRNGQLYRNGEISSAQPVAEDMQSVSFNSPYPNILHLQISASSGEQKYVLETRCSSRMDS